jgi:acyl-CoA reductase-like NAD-dependent aldehyde dehydrogenase
MQLPIAGEWVSRERVVEVRSPYGGRVVDTVPVARADDVDLAVAAAVDGAQAMRRIPAHERAAALERAADLLAADAGELASLLTAEVGKPIAEARVEASRVPELLRWCAAEAMRPAGEVLTMDAVPAGVGRLGFTLPEPCGVVVAITPFNYPALLVMHKVAPALAAGNAVIVKPATSTPLAALFLARRLLDAGLPPRALQVLCGPGPAIGSALCADPRVRKISFTGSHAVGAAIARAAGAKRLTCELGANCALLVFEDADVDAAGAAVARSGFTNAGQVCISAQRVLAHDRVRDALLDRVTAGVDALDAGDPADEETTLGPVIDAGEAERVTRWLAEAKHNGARLVRGGSRDGAFVDPAIIVDPAPGDRVWREELFGPAVAVRGFASEEEALAHANDSRYGLAVGLYTRDLDRAMSFARELRSGVVHINSGPLWRTDFMPYGGVGDSGFGKEGARYAMEEMSERKLVVVHPASG